MDIVSLRVTKQLFAYDRMQYYAVVNTIADDAAKIANDLSNSEAALFNAIIDALFEAEDSGYTIGLIEAQNLGNEVANCTKLKPSQALGVVDKFVERGWLRKDRRGKDFRIGFGVRSAMELPPVRELNRRLAMGGELGQEDADTSLVTPTPVWPGGVAGIIASQENPSHPSIGSRRRLRASKRVLQDNDHDSQSD
mmetsp:Transcript_12073/g.24589  ORF Transcript_12073/g.24589 Transcript_12073/m.24589 type:complete len:195 (-) Transcript_12073:190-774(-)